MRTYNIHNGRVISRTRAITGTKKDPGEHGTMIIALVAVLLLMVTLVSACSLVLYHFSQELRLIDHRQQHKFAPTAAGTNSAAIGIQKPATAALPDSR